MIGLALLAAAASPPRDAQNVQAALTSARTLAIQHYTRIQSETGFADELVTRLDSDLSAVLLADPSQTASFDQLSMRAALDISLVAQLTGSSPAPVLPASNAALRLVRSSTDHTLQPLAIYVPASYGAQRSVPLIVVLHGQAETETGLIAQPVLRQLADASGALLAAPRVRGDTPASTAANNDVYDALSFLEANYHVDARRTYLAGVSLGGFDVFTIAPKDPQRWTAVMSIAGTLTNDDKDAFAAAMRGKSVYLVAGTDDAAVAAAYVRSAVTFLTQSGIECHYYEQRGGADSLASLQPAVAQAWNDMLARGVHFSETEDEIPSPVPTSSLRY